MNTGNRSKFILALLFPVVFTLSCATDGQQTSGAIQTPGAPQGTAGVDSTRAAADAGALELATNAAAVLEARMKQPTDERIPADLVQQAECIAVFPSVIRAGLIIGVRTGSGLVSCRDDTTGELGAPAVFNIRAASVGLQAGVQSTKLILLATSDEGVDALLAGGTTLGGGVGVSAGPVGFGTNVNTAQADIVSYAESSGLFAGVDLEGSSISFAEEANQDIYGQQVDPEELLYEMEEIPESLAVFSNMLDEYTSEATQAQEQTAAR